jgi:predicted dehydrogenase
MHPVRATDFFGPKQRGGSAGALTRLVPWFPERFKEAYLNEMRYLVECVRADRSPSPDGEDDQAAMEIALAATESLKSGRPVELSGRQR